MKANRSFWMLVALVMLAAGAQSQVPGVINYQAQLSNASGPLSGPHTIVFAIYDALTGGTKLWEETHSINIPTTANGFFSRILGKDGTPDVPLPQDIFDSGTERYLELTVDGVVSSPRQQYGSVPYAFRSNVTLEQAYAHGNGRTITADDGAVNIAGPDGLMVNGNVGIGTSIPDSKLHVSQEGSNESAGHFTNNTGNGIAGSTIRAVNVSTGSGIAGTFETRGTDATVVLGNSGSGPLLKAFGANGGEDEFRIENDGTVMLFDASFSNTIRMSAATGRTTTRILEITGGSDLSEQFEVNGANEAGSEAALEPTQPGMVVSIDPNQPGKLVISTEAYDYKVAGIISGAGGIKTGMLMGQDGSTANGTTPVALAGRVYCWADASYGTIKPGDLLTTSNTPGHAMKVTDHAQAQGAILGKAMTSLANGKGLVLVLVTLQ